MIRGSFLDDFFIDPSLRTEASGARIYKPCFRENKPNSFSMSETDRFGLVFAKTGSIIFGHGSLGYGFRKNIPK